MIILNKALFLICALMFSFLYGCSCDNKVSEDQSVMLPNPFVYVDSLKSASLGAGFDFVCPDSVEGYSSKDISYIKNDLIQVVFREGEKSLCLRKARGCDDVSGDYNIYKKVESHSVNGLDVTVKSNADGLYVSIWNNGQFAFAVNSNSPLSERFMDYLISQMK